MACGGDDDGLERAGSKAVDGAVVNFDEAPDSYTITYRVTAAAGDGDEKTVSTERLVVDRPFSSRVEVRSGDDVVARRVSRFGVLALESESGVRLLAAPPALGTSDVRPDAVLDDAVERGLAERRERREVAGRPCQVYRLGSTASDGSLVPVGTASDEHADLCVDARGLVLEEWWVQHGRPLRHRLAVDVDDSARVPAAQLQLDGEAVAATTPSDGSVVGSDAQAPLALDPPLGFRHIGHYEVTPAQLNPPGSGGDAPAPRTTVADVWTSGVDLLVLDQGGGPVAPHPYAESIDVPGLGTGELILDLRASEVRITLDDGSTLRLFGTVPPGELVALAGTVAPTAASGG